MNGFWTASGLVQHAAIVASSAWNASYFARRAIAGSEGHTPGERARRVAAGILALLFAALAVETLVGLPVASNGIEVARRTPLLLATVAVAFLVSYGPSSSTRGAGGAR